MYQEERLHTITEHLHTHERIAVDDICRWFDVSRDTARRDLSKLEARGEAVRTHGGALLAEKRHPVTDYAGRLQLVSEEKKRIGSMAAAMIHPGERIILDASTTVQACTEAMPDIACTVVTNSINQADILSTRTEVDIHLLGGHLDKEHRFLYGTSVIERLKTYQVDKVFLGVLGVSENGLTLAHEEDGWVKRQMVKQAAEVIVLADHTKLGKADFFTYAALEDVDVLITDRPPSPAFQSILAQHHVSVQTADADKGATS
ncbi:DeoR/GlpR family DNA-binding transcription regulator [Alkalicoccus urumqiensis]|uniref:DeoR/GlpR transcriptional regulator n=1 Tax=Alkalicoccus urumqiensis TaxID=1548213 RepID=A0A2P6MLF6_ALKUR|nr:DeoR/GlpR family DNA-binding transcription regulator [Alkalicoccus urumqiensis]PRO67112.1 DeoR/GlpR transcriptional regulator [Alkalicoccus urumqiensis]